MSERKTRASRRSGLLVYPSPAPGLLRLHLPLRLPLPFPLLLLALLLIPLQGTLAQQDGRPDICTVCSCASESVVSCSARDITQLPSAGGRVITELNLEQNFQLSLSAADFEEYSSLMLLSLKKINLTAIPNDFFAALQQLEHLDLSVNPIIELQPHAFRGLSHLLYLDLSEIKVSTLPVLLFESTRNLTTLNYLGADFGVTGETPAALTHLPAGIFDPLTNLRILDFTRQWNLQSLPPGALWPLRQLEMLDFGANRGLSENFVRRSQDYRTLTQLKRLRIEGMNLVEFPRLPVMPAITYFNYAANFLQRIPYKLFNQWITSLDELRGNYLAVGSQSDCNLVSTSDITCDCTPGYINGGNFCDNECPPLPSSSVIPTPTNSTASISCATASLFPGFECDISCPQSTVLVGSASLECSDDGWLVRTKCVFPQFLCDQDQVSCELDGSSLNIWIASELQDPVPRFHAQQANVTHLEIMFNQTLSLSDSFFIGWEHLEELDLHILASVQLSEEIFLPLTELYALRIYGPAETASTPVNVDPLTSSMLGRLEILEVLELHALPAIMLNASHFQVLPYLTRFVARQCPLVGQAINEDPSTYNLLQRLKYLDLSYSSVDRLGASDFAGNVLLEAVLLEGTNLKSVDPNGFAALPYFQYARMSSPPCSDSYCLSATCIISATEALDCVCRYGNATSQPCMPGCPTQANTFSFGNCFNPTPGSVCTPICTNSLIAPEAMQCTFFGWDIDGCRDIGTECGSPAALVDLYGLADVSCGRHTILGDACNISCDSEKQSFASCVDGSWQFTSTLDAQNLAWSTSFSCGSSSSMQVAIIGGAIGAVAFVILIVVILLCRRTRTRTKQKLSTVNLLEVERKQAQIKSELERCNVLLKDLGQSYNTSLQTIARSELAILRELGRGAFGVVQLASFTPSSSKQAVQAAVKMLPAEFATLDEQASFLVEAQLMSVLRHPCLVSVFGLCMESETPWLIMEYMKSGNLRDYLRTQAALSQAPSNLTWDQLLNACISIADGMAYLSSKNVVHRDLACRNVLVGSSLDVVKISDYGMARYLSQSDYYRMTADRALPLRWMAPESLEDQIWTTHSDVWSCGITFWEIITLGQTPYPGISLAEVSKAQASMNRFMARPPNCPAVFYEIISSCWIRDAKSRPTFDELLRRLIDTRATLRASPALVVPRPLNFEVKQNNYLTPEVSLNDQNNEEEDEDTETRL
eukprot:m.225913 g.225913  ORF g.225913 m.225913 type:complete len:1218 (+) comp17044_c0_seq6:175-3828(+)